MQWASNEWFKCFPVFVLPPVAYRRARSSSGFGFTSWWRHNNFWRNPTNASQIRTKNKNDEVNECLDWLRHLQYCTMYRFQCTFTLFVLYIGECLPPRELNRIKKDMSKRHIVVEQMDIMNAMGTFNVLNGEDRRIAVALLVADEEWSGFSGSQRSSGFVFWSS